ncbi:tyrosine-type recombinase/integrase [Synechocystis sp. PCC 7509]|uniref:tyrosine-type recombinase/integrase n=1 Tax=Synechocystis sp. PCC 7509 TaxID=927677 RepID=UPI0002ABFF3D|nr:tyrosine-type recombinase/integrase [Synechocystis sp. PCC 7509]
MKVQRIRLPNSEKVTWVVLDDNNRFVEPIKSYLKYLESLQRSPNTIHSYANHLKLYWEFLRDSELDWTEVNLENLADFISWLRRPDPRVIFIHEQESRRLESTINTMLSVVCSFYDYHERIGNTEGIDAYKNQFQLGKKYKSFLHHINKGKETRTRLLKLKQPKKLPKTYTLEQTEQLTQACKRIRDKFLVCLLHETGMRIGQALGLRHEDIRSWDNEIQIVPRDDNANSARAKTRETYTIHVSKQLMSLYSEYITLEYPEDIDSDYLFINIWEGKIGYPLNYSTIQALFRRLSRDVGIEASPHMFRHTHATELIRSGMEMSYVQKRLGHASIQTTIDTYTHLTLNDLKEAYQSYLEERLNDGTKL